MDSRNGRSRGSGNARSRRRSAAELERSTRKVTRLITSVYGLVAASVGAIIGLAALAASLFHLAWPAGGAHAAPAAGAPPGHSASPGGRPYLSGSEPVGGNDYGGAAAATVSHRLYPHSVQVGCRPAGAGGGYAEWTVGGADGRPARFVATVGIADDTPGASAAAADLSFTDQDRHPLADTVTVTLGHPRQVSLAMPATAVRLRVGCVSRDLAGAPGADRPPPPPPPYGGPPPGGRPPPPDGWPGPRDFYATLGDAVLGS